MIIEVSPSSISASGYTATFIQGTIAIAEIVDAPHDIATQWAEAMKELHGGHPEIRRIGICFFCKGTRRNGEFCMDCDRVFTR